MKVKPAYSPLVNCVLLITILNIIFSISLYSCPQDEPEAKDKGSIHSLKQDGPEQNVPVRIDHHETIQFNPPMTLGTSLLIRHDDESPEKLGKSHNMRREKKKRRGKSRKVLSKQVERKSEHTSLDLSDKVSTNLSPTLTPSFLTNSKQLSLLAYMKPPRPSKRFKEKGSTETTEEKLKAREEQQDEFFSSSLSEVQELQDDADIEKFLVDDFDCSDKDTMRYVGRGKRRRLTKQEEEKGSTETTEEKLKTRAKQQDISFLTRSSTSSLQLKDFSDKCKRLSKIIKDEHPQMEDLEDREKSNEPLKTSEKITGHHFTLGQGYQPPKMKTSPSKTLRLPSKKKMIFLENFIMKSRGLFPQKKIKEQLWLIYLPENHKQ
ncbi:hypothetical protein IM40_10805 (plasmid) [Candidatus Paracaedimonas acanthamoebae]|nr:hypothetical protein IM40_10805 [Candidatus Paracaedimonas acanthamoebae]